MKKLFLLIVILLISICMMSCGVSNFKYRLKVDLDTHIDANASYLDVKVYLKRSLTEFGEGDNGGYSYFGISPYSYKVYFDDTIIYEYNNEDKNIEKTEANGLNKPIWFELVPHENSIEIMETGNYRVEVDCNFKYTFTSKEYSYSKEKTINIDLNNGGV